MISSSSVSRVDGLNLAVAQFLAALTDDQRIELNKNKTLPTDANSIIAFTAQLDAENRRRTGSVSSRVGTLLQATRDFCAVVDTFVSSNPSIAALVWGSVKLTLLIVLNYTSYYGAITTLFMQIGRLCPLFSEYGTLYKTSRPLQKCLSDFQASIVRCCKHAVEAIQRPWQRQALQAFYSSFNQEFSSDMDDIRQCSDRVKDAIGLAKAYIDETERQLQIRERADASRSRRALTTFLGRKEVEDAALRDLLIQKEERKKQEQRQRLLDALSAHRPERLLKQNQRKRFHATANWIHETQEFTSWLSPTGSPVLWCSGKIGSGKTIVATSVVDHLFLQHSQSGSQISYFFVSSSDRESVNAETILRSILRQCLPSAADLVPEIATKLQRVVDGQGVDELGTCFLSSIPSSKPFYLVIDGLDECEKPDRDIVLQALSCLVAKRGKMRLFLSSRENIFEEIQHYLPEHQRVTMDSPGARDDIATYVDGILRERREAKKLVVGDIGLIDEIKEALLENVDGMFLWASLQVDEVCEQVCDEDIRKTIEDLPKSLEETYMRALRRISSRSHQTLAQKAFVWIAAAARPLTLEEMREAIAIEINQEYTIRERLCNDANKIVVACQNLVHVDEEDGSVQFAHHSIRHFLVQGRRNIRKSMDDSLRPFFVDFEEADHYIGEICITYLSFNDFKTTLVEREKPVLLPSPSEIATLAVSSESGARSRLLQKILQKRASPFVHVSRILPRPQALLPDHPFLNYASANWLVHTRNFARDRSHTWHLMMFIVLGDNKLAHKPWDTTSDAVEDAVLDWALQAKHNGLSQLCILSDTAARQIRRGMSKAEYERIVP